MNNPFNKDNPFEAIEHVGKLDAAYSQNNAADAITRENGPRPGYDTTHCTEYAQWDQDIDPTKRNKCQEYKERLEDDLDDHGTLWFLTPAFAFVTFAEIEYGVLFFKGQGLIGVSRITHALAQACGNIFLPWLLVETTIHLKSAKKGEPGWYANLTIFGIVLAGNIIWFIAQGVARVQWSGSNNALGVVLVMIALIMGWFGETLWRRTIAIYLLRKKIRRQKTRIKEANAKIEPALANKIRVERKGFAWDEWYGQAGSAYRIAFQHETGRLANRQPSVPTPGPKPQEKPTLKKIAQFFGIGKNKVNGSTDWEGLQ